MKRHKRTTLGFVQVGHEVAPIACVRDERKQNKTFFDLR